MVLRVILYGLLLSSLVLHGQDHTIELDSVLVRASALRQVDPGARNMEITSSLPMSSLGLQLNQAHVFARHNGPGSVATVSIRGGSTSQTSLLWNGIPIHNPMLGLVDFNLIPVQIVDRVEVKPGGSTAIWGSGAVAGTIHFNNQAPEESQLALQSEAGSFGYHSGFLSMQEIRKKWKSSTRIFYNQSPNQFPYVRGGGRQISENAAYGQKGLMQSLYVSLGKKMETSSHIWLQKSTAEIPPLLTQKQSLARQDDHALRVMISLKSIGKISTGHLKLAFASEKNHFEDPLSIIDNTNLFQNWMADYFHDYQIKSFWKSGFGGTFVHSNAIADAYDSKREENRYSFFANQLFYGHKWNFLLAIRQEWREHFKIPVSPILSANWQVISGLSIKTKISRDYRLPTFNDRFWLPGGNPDLKPESGWSREIGLNYHRDSKKGFLELEGTVFYRRIQDWILWGRQEGQIFFSPANIALVRSRGLEITNNYKYNLSGSKFTLMGTLNYTYTRSTHEQSQKNPTIRKGDQLIYTPEHQGSLFLQLISRDRKISYQHYFTGPYQGINQRLPGYSTAEIQVVYPANIFHREWHFYGQISNLWNINYQIIEQRPIPGRNFKLGFRLSFFKGD